MKWPRQGKKGGDAAGAPPPAAAKKAGAASAPGGGAGGDLEAAVGPVQAKLVEATLDDRPPLSLPRRPSALSRFFFFFVDPIVRYGHHYQLEPENMWRPEAVDTVPLHASFDRAWRKQLRSPTPDIKRAVWANSAGTLIATGLLYLLSMAAQLVGPMMLQRIVAGLGCWSKQGGASGGACPTQRQLY